MVAARKLREAMAAFFNHLFAYRRVVVSARRKISLAHELLNQGIESDGVYQLVSLAYGPAVASWIRREALKELLLWALASNNSALAESTANHLSGGFGFKTYRRPAHRELEHLLEHYSREQNWAAADGYRAFLNIRVRPFTQDAYAAANFGFGLPRDIFGDKVIRQMQLLWLNHILKLHDLSQFQENLLLVDPITIDDLGKLNHETAQVSGGPLVSIVVPVFNGEQWLGTALDGLVKQTYRNIEILVVDDKSTDGTRALVSEWAKRDSRVRLIEQKVNGGSYRARNTGLEAAKGEFVTVHDADDWSHPAKVQMQVEHLQANPNLVANLSPGIRIENLRFKVHPVRGREYCRPNLSSMMFRRELIRRELGFWDEVRFGADSEFFERLQARFGRKAVRDIKAGPLSFTRLHAASLTGGGYSSTATGINGIRRYYTDAYAQWHQAIRSGKAKALIGRESVGRPFAVPLLLSKRDAVLPKFDLVLHADLGANSGDLPTVFAAIATAADASGKRLALIHRTTNRDYPSEVLDEGIRAKLDFAAVTLLIPGDSASAKLVRVLHPELLAALPAKRPALKADAVELVGGEGIDAATAEALAKHEFGGKSKWVR